MDDCWLGKAKITAIQNSGLLPSSKSTVIDYNNVDNNTENGDEEK